MYVDPDVGDAGIVNNGGETLRTRMVKGSMGAEWLSPSAGDASGLINLGKRQLMRHHRRFRVGVGVIF